ncbi:MAG: hypothetical protein OEY89_16170, partial [Gammaproteobacteria bacterium]|nr:hypothetical protein [Gammaproteobacteria bacterium]
DKANFSIDMSEKSIVIHAKSKLAEKIVLSKRYMVVALALAEIKKQLGIRMDIFSTVFIEIP